MSAAHTHPGAPHVDRERFAAAVNDGLTNPELAARFGVSKDTAAKRAAPLRKVSLRTRTIPAVREPSSLEGDPGTRPTLVPPGHYWRSAAYRGIERACPLCGRRIKGPSFFYHHKQCRQRASAAATRRPS